MDKIGKYRILGKIGQGATSTVYKGHDATLGRHVAVKMISADVGADETQRKRFQREAQAAARLAHPHIVTVYEFGQEGDKLYLAMELLEGMDLKQAIAERRLRTLDEKLDVIEQICDGLSFAHQHAIVHRDLKPANIHLLPDGQIKVMDFGLARLSGSDMTRTGLVMGTPHYMSPEQVRGEHVDTRSDVFSLGCVLYELLTERKPFDAESLHSVLYMVLQAQPRPPREIVKDLPAVVQQLLERAMARDTAGRFPDASAFLRAVQLVREAVAAGRGDEPMPELEAPPASSVPSSGSPAPKAEPPPAPEAPGARSASVSRGERPTSRSGSGARSASGSARTHRSNLPLLAVGGLAVAAVAVAVGLWMRPVAPAASSSPGKAAPQIDKLARAVAETEVELAEKRLAAGDYDDAAYRAERALKFDPDHAGAKDVLAKARQARERIDASVAEARAAGSDPSRAADAYWRLLELAPDHAAAAELAPRLDPSLRSRAEEARQRATAARQGAEKARANRVDSFQEGISILQEAEAALKGRRYAVAARDYMRARIRFERAERTGR